MTERKKRGPRGIDEYTKKRIVTLKGQGVRTIVIASRLGVSVSTVEKFARLNGYRGNQRLYTNDDLLTLVEMFMEGYSNAEIAKKMNRTYWAIAIKIHSLGLKRASKFATSKNHVWHQELKASYLKHCSK